jgi:hypothetical protein
VLEVADIAGSDTEAELQSGSADQQILEGDTYSLLGLLAFDASREFGCLDRHRMHGHVADEFIYERLPALPPFLQFGALNAVRQFHHGDHGKTNLDFSVASFEVFEDLPHSVALALGGDDHAGIED